MNETEKCATNTMEILYVNKQKLAFNLVMLVGNTEALNY